MRRRWVRKLLLWLRQAALLCTVLVASATGLLMRTDAHAETGKVNGRPLIELLRDLRNDGINVVFSTDMVDPAWRVEHEPVAANASERLAEMLSPFGLMAQQLAPQAYVIVHADANQQLAGIILDRERGVALQSARVELSPGHATAKSDQRGRFAFKKLRPGLYSVRVSLADYQDALLARVAVPSVAGPVTISLHPNAVSINQIEISASRYRLSGPDTVRAMSLSAAQFASQPGLREDALRATNRIPGFAQHDLSSAAYVRGGDANEILIRVDGFAIRQPFHSPGYQSPLSVFDPAIVSQMEVLTGGFPARYGNRMSAVVDVTTAHNNATMERELGLSALNVSARAAGPLPGTVRWDGLGMLRLGTLHYLVDAFAPNSSNPSYADGFGRIHFAASSDTDLYGYVLAAHDELSVVDHDRGERGRIDSQSSYLWLKGSHRWGDYLQANAWFGQSSIDSERSGTMDNSGIGSGTIHDTRRSRTWDLRSEWQWLVNSKHQLEGGVEASYGTAHYDYSRAVSLAPIVAELFGRAPSSSSRINVAPERHSFAGFLTHRWRPLQALSTEIGVRLQRESSFGLEAGVLLDPRVALRWELAPQTQLRFAWGVFHQADEAFQLRVEDGITTFESPQRSEHWVLGLDHQLSNGTLLRMEGFRKTQTDPRIRFENVVNPLAYFAELAPDRVRIAPDHAELRGVELSAAGGGEPWSWWASYTYAEAVDEIGAQEIARSWDQRHSLSVGVEWKRGPWEVAATARAHSGWRTTPLFADKNGRVVLGERNSELLPTYATLDLRIARRWQFNHGELNLAFELTNATNRSNVCCRDFSLVSSPSGAPQLATESTTWLPLLPAVTVRWKF